MIYGYIAKPLPAFGTPPLIGEGLGVGSGDADKFFK